MIRMVMKHTKEISFIYISLIVIILLNACSKDPDGGGMVNCNGVATSFSVNVNPLIQSFCNQPSCHHTGSTNGPGALTNYSQVFNARADIRTQVQSGLMPENTTLTTAQKNTIICWIDAGAPNN